MRVQFTVFGKPQPQGSAKAFIPKGWNRAVITSDNKTLKPWRQDVSMMAQHAMGGQDIATGPVSVEISFSFARPKSVKAPHKTTKPDLDKLLRGILDSLSGIVFRDDAQVVHCSVSKQYGLPEGAQITVHENHARP